MHSALVCLCACLEGTADLDTADDLRQPKKLKEEQNKAGELEGDRSKSTLASQLCSQLLLHSDGCLVDVGGEDTEKPPSPVKLGKWLPRQGFQRTNMSIIVHEGNTVCSRLFPVFRTAVRRIRLSIERESRADTPMCDQKTWTLQAGLFVIRESQQTDSRCSYSVHRSRPETSTLQNPVCQCRKKIRSNSNAFDLQYSTL